jgi:hypothetical protein
MKQPTVVLMSLFALFAGLVGCGNEVAKPTADQSAAVAPEEAVSTTPPVQSAEPPMATAEAKPAEAEVTVVADGPAGAVQSVFVGLQNGKLDPAWNMLPASYQADVETIIRDFSAKMDPEIWNASFGVLKKAINVLETKADVILAMPVFQQAAATSSPEEVRKGWNGLVGVLKTIAESDLSDLEKMKSANVTAFVSTTGNKIVGQLKELGQAGEVNPFAKLSQVQVKLVSHDDQSAVVEITKPDEEEPETVELTLVEGKWIPKSLAEGWAEQVTKAKEQLANIDAEAIAAAKEQVLAQINGVDATLDGLLAAKNAEEFNQAVFPIVMQASMMAMQFNQPAAPSQEDQIEVRVTGELSDEQQEMIFDKLNGLIPDDANAEFSASSSGGVTTIMLAPVPNITEFASKIDFATVKSVDAEKKLIELELKPDAN